MADLSLWLDSYDDIYSDFDSRHYLKRRMSEDFIDELKMSLKYRTEQPDTLVLMLPAQMRNTAVEKEILSSIKLQVEERLQAVTATARKIRLRGSILFLSGVAVMAVDAVVVRTLLTGYFITVLRIFMEPAGWFMMWNGLDFLIYDFRKVKREVTFYSALHQLHIHFKDI